MSDDETEDTEDYSPPAPDRFADAIALCQIAKNKTIATALKKLRRVNRQIADAEAKVIAVQDQVEQKEAALAAREAKLDARDTAITRRENEFAASAQDVRDELREHHNRIEQAHRQLVYRLMSTAGILGNWNENLQDLPTWEQLRRQIADLPADPPGLSAEPTEAIDLIRRDVGDERSDHLGNAFAPSTLRRDVSHKRSATHDG